MQGVRIQLAIHTAGEHTTIAALDARKIFWLPYLAGNKAPEIKQGPDGSSPYVEKLDKNAGV
jgi:hypothetical protein